MLRAPWVSLALLSLLALACKKQDSQKAGSATKTLVGLVTDVGGRGDQSFNDSALRGLELWAAGKKWSLGGYKDAPVEEIARSIPPELSVYQPPLSRLPITPIVLQSKAQEDYQPNLQLLADEGVSLVVGVGFMLEDAVAAVARRDLRTKFLLIDSPLLDEQNRPYTLPNVRSVVFREEEGSFLVGAMAGLVTQSGKIGFVGGMQIPLVQRFEAGFRAGVLTTQPAAARELLVTYTGSFDNVATGKQVAEDLLAKGVDVIFHAAGADGLGVIQAVKEARASNHPVYAIGVDSDQAHLAPKAVLTSMIKHVDLAVYLAIRDFLEDKFTSGDLAMGLKEDGVAYAPVRLDFPRKQEALARVEELKRKIIAGQVAVPRTPTELASFKAPL